MPDSMVRMLRVGLTGGIGAGKSTVAARLVEHGAELVDADAIAREVVEPGTDGLAEIVAEFGEDVLTADGALDRPALAEIAFATEQARQRLNGIVHPKIAAKTAQLMTDAAPDAVVVHDVPLLVEGGLAAGYHLVLVVDADEQVRVHRLGQARGMSEHDAKARIAAQATVPQRMAAADVWLDNSGAPESVRSAVDTVWADRLVPFEANIRLRRPRPAESPQLTDYDETWPVQAERVLARVRKAAGDKAVRVDHIGSTSVPGLPAKDVLDLQLAVSTLDEADAAAESLADAGFIPAEGAWFDTPQDGADRSDCTKRFHFGADPGRPVNLHVRSCHGPAWRLALLFRDWLRANPQECAAYSALKRRLAQAHADDGSVEAYTAAKQGWVDAAFGRADEWARRIGWEPDQPGS